MKIIGLRHHYFTTAWNLFDFILVIASIVGIVMKVQKVEAKYKLSQNRPREDQERVSWDLAQSAKSDERVISSEMARLMKTID